MYYLSYICFICYKDIDKLQTVYVNETEDAVQQMKYILPEITLEPEIPLHICSKCHTKLHSFYAFKKQCLENYCHFTEKLQESGNAKDQSFNAFQIEIKNIKEKNKVDVDLTNEAPEKNGKINFVTKEDTVKVVQDETISPGLNKIINEVSGMTDDIKSFECEQEHDQTNNFIEDNIDIKEDIIKFEDSEEPNLYQELLSDIKKEIDSEQDINEIECADLNINDSELTVSNLIISSNLNQKINKDSNRKEEIKSFKSEICNKKFTQRSDLNSLIKINSKIKNYQCYICEKKFTRKSNLEIHIKAHTGVKDFKCSICEKKFIRNRELILHMKIHTGDKDFHCSICEKKFIRNIDLKLHMKTHTGVKDFKCSICQKKFMTNSTLKLHMKTHAGVKDYQCSICEKQFTQKGHLILHMKIHTGIKDFQCSVCERQFTQHDHMKQHMKIHTGVKDFKCSICEKKYITNSTLKAHMKRHTSVQNFQCSICEKQFKQNGNMKLHMKIHTGVQDFHCSICEKKFMQKSSLIRHIKLLHEGIRDFE